MEDDERRHERYADMQHCLWRAVLARQNYLAEPHQDDTGLRDIIGLISNDAGFSELLFDRDREAIELLFTAAAAIITFEIQRNRMYGGADGQTDYTSWHIEQLLYRHFTPEENKQRLQQEMQAQADETRAQERAKLDQEKVEHTKKAPVVEPDDKPDDEDEPWNDDGPAPPKTWS